MMVEKRNLSGMQLVREIARHFRVPQDAIGYAGLKDKHAVTRQVVSVHLPGRAAEGVPSLKHASISVLWVDRHAKKLKRGQLAGNRFSIRVRGVPMTAALTAKRVLDRLACTGVPDRFGEQRFGYLRNNHLVGREIILREYAAAARLLCGTSPLMPAEQAEARRLFESGDFRGAARAFPPSFRTERAVLEGLANGETPEQAIESIEPGVLSFYISAFQSAVFNAVLDRRVVEGSLGVLRQGDIAGRPDGGETFAVDEVALADPRTAERLAAFEICATGPLWGARMERAGGETGRVELECLRAVGVTPDDLERALGLDIEMLGGARRPLRVAVQSIEVEGGTDEHGSYLRCAFDLPRGAFATTVMEEVMKSHAAGGA